MGRKKTNELAELMPDYEAMGDAELEREATILKLKKEFLVVAKEAFIKAEREKELCNIQTALTEFSHFLQPVKDFLIALPDLIQDRVPSMTPDEYTAIQALVSEQTERLAQNALHLTITASKTEKELSSDIMRARRRRANIVNGRGRDAK